MIRVAFTGGGSGGHIYPIIAVSQALKKLASHRGKEVQFLYLGDPGQLSQDLLEAGISFKKVASSKLRRYASSENVADFFKFPIGVLQAMKHLFSFMPDVLFSKGGPGSFQVVFAAWLFRIPIVIHESDAVPGMANLWAAKFASRIGVAFQDALKYFPKEITALVGNPIRSELVAGDLQDSDFFQINLTLKKKIILVLGGSQGAKTINDVILLALPELLKFGQLVHQTGLNNYQEVRVLAEAIANEVEAVNKIDYKILPFIQGDMLYKLFKVTNLVIARAGSGIIFETAFHKKPSILVPISQSPNDHQLKNALAYQASGACKVLEEKNLTPNVLATMVKHLLTDENMIQSMSQRAGEFAVPDSDRIIASELLLFARS